MNEKAILGSIAKNFLALFLVLVILITAFPIVAHIDVDAAEADVSETSANVTSGSGNWVGGLTYTYTVGTSSTNTDGASGSVLVSDSTMTLSATNAKQTTTGSGCNAKTTDGADTTTTVTVNNNTDNYLKITSLSVAGDAQTGVELGKIIFPNRNFTIKVVSPKIAEDDKQEEKSGSVTIEVTPVTIDNTISFLSPQKIDGATPGSYTISDGTSASYTSGATYSSTLLTEFTLNATTSSGYTFNGWIVNGKRVSTSTVYKTTFVNETNTVRPDYIRSTTTDPLEKIAVLDSDDSSLSKYDVAEYDSYYEPSGYTHVTGTESGNHPSNTATALNYNSYEGIKSSGNGKYIQKDMENVSWTVSDNTASITASRSGTSYGDNSGYSNKDGSVKTNAKVLRIRALQTINVSFNYNVTEWMEDADSSISNGRQIAFFYSLITNSEAPTLTDLKGGTSWGGTASSFLEDASHSGHFEETISAGQYLYLWFCGYGYSYTSGGNNGAFGYSFSSAVSDVVIRQEARKFNLQTGAIDGAGNMIGSGAVTVNNQDYTVGSNGLTNKLTELNGSQHMSLSVKTVPTGYTHIGWRIVDNGVSTDVFDSAYEFNIESDSTVYALFSPKITVTAGGINGFASATYSYTKGSGANQYIARSSDGTTWYKDLNTAFTEQSTVVLATNVDLSGSFTIPSGKTLSVPYGLADVATTDLQRISGSGAISSYITLTVKDSLTVSGNLVASARQEQSTGGYGRIFGKAGYVKVDGSMSVSGTGKLYAYGMITGAGQINVASGGYVYELAEFRDMRQIQAMMDAYQHGKAFPFSHFFIKNNEVSTTYAAGSYLKAMYYINVSGITAGGEIPLIGKSTDSEAMFKIADGSLTKAFSSAKNNKIIFRVESGGNIQTGNFSINMTATIAGISQDVNINSANYVVPLCYGYGFEVENGGNLTLNSDYKLLPGALIDVKEGGTLTIANGKKLVLYRANDYDFRSYSKEAAQGFCQNGYPNAFTKPSDLTYASNTAANVGSAKLNVDGTLNAIGGLYVTNQTTGNTAYNNGYNYLTGTGSIVFDSALSSTTIYEEKQKGSDTTESVTVACVPIKGITDYEVTTDNGQTDYNSLTQGTWYGMINESGVNVWSTSRAILSYDANGVGTAPASVAKPANMDITVAENTYTGDNKQFAGWNTKADGSGTSYNAGTTIQISEDTTLYAQWINVCTVTFNANGHGTAPDSQTVEAGQNAMEPDDPSATGYTFGGWYKEADCTNAWNFLTDKVTENTELFAKWTLNTYTVTWLSDKGAELAKNEGVSYGSAPSFEGTVAEQSGKTAVWDYSYTLEGESTPTTGNVSNDELSSFEVKADVTFTLAYKTNRNIFFVNRFYNYNNGFALTSAITTSTKTLGVRAHATVASYDTDKVTLEAPVSNVNSLSTAATNTYSLVDWPSLDFKYRYTEFVGWYVTTYSSSKFKSIYGSQDTFAGKTAQAIGKFTPEKLEEAAEKGWYTPAGETITVTGATHCFAIYKSAPGPVYRNAYYTTNNTTLGHTLAKRSTVTTSAENNSFTLESAATTSSTSSYPIYYSLSKTTTIDYQYSHAKFLGWYVADSTGKSLKDNATTIAVKDLNNDKLYEQYEAGNYFNPGDTVTLTAAQAKGQVYVFAIYENTSLKQYTPRFYDKLPDDTTKLVAYSTTPTVDGYTYDHTTKYDWLTAFTADQVPQKNSTETVVYTPVGYYYGKATSAPAYNADDANGCCGGTYAFPTTSNRLYRDGSSISYSYVIYYRADTRYYTAKYLNWDGTELAMTAQVEYNNVPAIPDAVKKAPTRPDDENYTYTFDHWHCSDGSDFGLNALPTNALTADGVTYKAVFEEHSLEPKHSLTLQGEIGVNFYIPKALVEDENSTATMSWGPKGADNPAHGEAEFEINKLTENNNENINVVFHKNNDGGLNTNNPIAKAKIYEDYYLFTAYVAAKQMADEITLTITDSNNGTVLTDTYRVADYCYEVIADKDKEVSTKLNYSEDKFTKLQTLCKSMLTYGSKAQTQFGYNLNDLADKDLIGDNKYAPESVSDFADYANETYRSDVDGMSFYGASMLLESETTYSVWFRYEDNSITPTDATAKIGDKTFTVETLPVEGDYDANYVRYNILNLPANLLTEDIKVNFDGTENTYNVQTYFYLALQSEDPDLTNTVTSLYDYNQKAVAYFG